MAAPMRHVWRKYLLWFANEHADFRLAELKSLAQIHKLDLHITEEYVKDQSVSPFWVVDLPSELEARKLISRSVLMRSVYELWGQGQTYPAMFQNVSSSTSQSSMKPYLSAEKTFCVSVDTYNKTLTQKEKIERIEALPHEVFPFQGKVRLKNPDNLFCLLEDYGKCGTVTPENPFQIYFGRWIADSDRDQVKTFHLQKRCFLGHTSMDAGLSLLMSNIAQVKENMLIFDPFVGTGSLLVACAYHNGYVMGTDIDYLLLHARGKPSRHNQKKRSKDESIRANLAQYGLEKFYVDAMVADASKHEMWRVPSMFDAIITDPPYGIREGAKRVGSEKEEIRPSQDENNTHISQKVDYNLTDIFKDLLNFAAKYLKLKGRLVYWLPVYKPDYQEENIPSHPCLELVSNCEQLLTKKISRRLITMEKCKHCQEEDLNHTAHIEVDHYSDATFREKYFNMRPQKSDTPSAAEGKDCDTKSCVNDLNSRSNMSCDCEQNADESQANSHNLSSVT